MLGRVSVDFMSFVIARGLAMFRLGDGVCNNCLKVQYYLHFGRHYYIYLVFIPLLLHKYKSLLVLSKIYLLCVLFFCRRLKLISKGCRHEAKRIQGLRLIEKEEFNKSKMCGKNKRRERNSFKSKLEKIPTWKYND